MGILDFLGLRWEPRQNMTYRYKRWHRRKRLIVEPPAFQGAGWGGVIGGYRKQNLSKVYIEIDGRRAPGTFKVSGEVCTVGVLGNNFKLHKLYSTAIQNVKFYKKDLGTRISGHRAKNYTHRYEYFCKVIDSKKLTNEVIPGQIVRRRGTAIVDTPKGILVASGRHKLFLLPGGGANRGESREKATIRELREETELKAVDCKYLFEYDEPDDGRKIRNLHKVFLIKVRNGVARPHSDVKHIAYWTPESDLRLSRTTKLIIDRYITEFKNE